MNFGFFNFWIFRVLDFWVFNLCFFQFFNYWISCFFKAPTSVRMPAIRCILFQRLIYEGHAFSHSIKVFDLLIVFNSVALALFFPSTILLLFSYSACFLSIVIQRIFFFKLSRKRLYFFSKKICNTVSGLIPQSQC